MSLYKGTTLIAGSLPNSANQDLSNLSQTGQAIIDGKADTDLTNTTDSAKVLMSGMGMPSGKYIDLTLGASGSTYTAPANGYYNIGYEAKTDCFVRLWSLSLATSQWQEGNWADLFLPVNKGQQIKLDYRNMTVRYFRFIYAQGSESEVS